MIHHVITLDLPGDLVVKTLELHRLREVIKSSHAGLLESCGGCSSCEYAKDLTEKLEGQVLWLVMESVRAQVPHMAA